MISRYALDCRPYNTRWEDVTWETCSLRSWLNDDLVKEAFSAEEQAKIPIVTVTADKNPNSDKNPGKDTQNRVFLLSIPEVNKYFTSDAKRQCKPTPYAKALGSSSNSNYHGACWWWLRTSGIEFTRAVDVYCNGTVGYDGGSVNNDDYAVRPAL